MQHVELEWDFYPVRQRAVISGEAEPGLLGQERGVWVLGVGALAHRAWEAGFCPREPAVTLTSRRS